MTTLHDTIRTALARRVARKALRRLDDRSLEDIGLNRADVETRFG